MTSTDWPSLAPQIALSERLFGPRGAGLLDTWLDEQTNRITDPGFARLFSDHIDLPGIAPGDYNHRLVRTRQGRMLGGIRFYGLDLARPFVEIVAHDMTDWEALRHCARAEWADFAPLHIRVLLPAGAALPPNGRIDMVVAAARYGEMTPPDGRVSLAGFERADEAIAMVARRYRDLAKMAPSLARDISPAAAEDLRTLHEEDRLKAIRAELDGRQDAVGLFAARPGAVEWIEGDVVQEEVVRTACNGHGFAASAQAAWAASEDHDPDRLLLGTIKGHNTASRRSALRAGRRELLAYAFLPLEHGR